MSEKARAKAAGTLGEYLYPCPLDRLLLDFLGVTDDAFLNAATTLADEDLVQWLAHRGAARTAKEVEAFNRRFLELTPHDEDGRRLFGEIRSRVAPQRTDVTTWVDLLDLEEGRPVG